MKRYSNTPPAFDAQLHHQTFPAPSDSTIPFCGEFPPDFRGCLGCGGPGISLEITLDKLIPGFVGKPKGVLQIAYERGFIDANKKNAGGKIVSWEGSIIKDTSTKDKHARSPRNAVILRQAFVQFCRIAKTSSTRSPSWNVSWRSWKEIVV
jgi:hypothetical protein